MFKFFHTLFVPHKRNNHRSKILHHSSLSLIILVLLFLSFGASTLRHAHPDILGISYSVKEDELLTLVNQERVKNGLSPLSLNSKLEQAATGKASDMFAKNYWAHFAPDGSTNPWLFIKNSGYNYLYAGENLAKGFTNSQDIVTAWMNSPSHRENILSNKYHDVGFSITEGKLLGEDTVLVVELFGSAPENVAFGAAPSDLAQKPKVETHEPAAPQQEVKKNETVAQEKVAAPKIDIASTSKTLSLSLFSFVTLALLLDVIIVEQKRIPRIVGHNIDHIILIILFVYFIILQRSGGIL